MNQSLSSTDILREELKSLDSVQHGNLNLAIDMTLGQIIKNRRVFLKMSQKELAEYVGCAESYIVTLENGTLRFRAHQLVRVMYALKIMPQEFHRQVFEQMQTHLNNPSSLYEVKK